MGLAHLPKIVTDGLAFLYDTADNKSYQGEPTTNLVTNPDFSTGNLTGWSSTSTSHGDVDVSEVSSENGYNFFHKKVNKTGNGGQDRLVESSTYNIDTSKRTTISIDFWTNPQNDYNITFYGRGTTADDTTYDEKPLSNNGTTTATVDLGDGWTRYIYTLQTGWYTGSGNTFRVAVYPDYGGRGLMEYKVRQMQVEQKPHVTPFVNGTRSATQGLLDRTKNSTIDISNVSFDSNAQMTFDGTDDYINDASFDMGTPTDITLECIIRFNGSLDSADRKVMHYNKGGSNGVFQLRKGNSASRLMYQAHNGSQWYTMTDTDAIESDTWAHFMITHSGTSAIMYKNGVQSATATMGNLHWTNANNLLIGYRANSEYWKGDIPTMKIYNRALTAAEVAQNFNAQRSRFEL